MNSSKWTTGKIKALKNDKKFACLTAYDYSTARLVDEAGIPLILVGDSLAMTMLGYDNTLPVTMNAMLHHTAAVVRGVKNALVVADMPFMSFHVSVQQTMKNAGRFIKSAGADAVKIEGGTLRTATVKALTENGIPVLGHIGLTPQSILAIGSYKVQGEKTAEAQQLIDDAKALEQAGTFAIVLECVPAILGKAITQAVEIPTIGIGAGPDCDGQILVIHDLLGIHSKVTPKFIKQYANLTNEMMKAFQNYKTEVEHGQFPGEEHCY